VAFTVSEILAKIKERIGDDEEIGGYITVTGEISGYRKYNRHAYFNLREEDSLLNCVFFNIPLQVSKNIKDGTVVEALGRISIYEKRGALQLYVSSMRQVTKKGYLQMKFEKMKEDLLQAGVIPKPPEEKREIPQMPGRIAVVTSREAAALSDVIRTLQTRYPLIELELFHTGVQGDVSGQIAGAIKRAENSRCETILIVRGGGSLEDLWCFNEREVVIAVRDSKKPIIAGIGHETDHTLSEYAADCIAPTPTGAAVLATIDLRDTMEQARRTLKDIDERVRGRLNQQEETLLNLSKRMRFANAENKLNQNEIILKSQYDKLNYIAGSRITQLQYKIDSIGDFLRKQPLSSKLSLLRSSLDSLQGRLTANSPDRYLEKGYARVEKEGEILKSVLTIKPGDLFEIIMKDGTVKSEAKQVDKKKLTDH